MSDEQAMSEFNKEDAIKESKNFLADILLKDPETREDLFVATNVEMNEDGSISIVCVKDIGSDNAIMHTIYSAYVTKANPEESSEEKTEDSNIITMSGKLVGLDGKPIN